MAKTGQFDGRLEFLVALSLQRLGSHTLGPRLLRALLDQRRGEPFDEACMANGLADGLEIPPAERGTTLAAARREAQRCLSAAASLGQRVVSILDPAYPPLLAQIIDPPIVLWIRGDPQALHTPAVAVVGSRNATPPGLAIARQLSKGLAEAGVTVTSGLARGVDGAAHRGALEGAGLTVGVLGSGVDVIYPLQHTDLAQAVLARGALASEFPPGTRPFPSHFPLRNRIISGLSQAVVVVEASHHSGSLITARAALEQGRDVLAVPGTVGSGCYRGCHALIKDGARLVETVDDILDEIGWARRAASGQNTGKSLLDNDLSSKIGVGESVSVDLLAERTGRSAPELLAELGRLEVAGKVVRMAGGTFARLD